MGGACQLLLKLFSLSPPILEWLILGWLLGAIVRVAFEEELLKLNILRFENLRSIKENQTKVNKLRLSISVLKHILYEDPVYMINYEHKGFVFCFDRSL